MLIHVGEVVPAFLWLESLRQAGFVGTESRLQGKAERAAYDVVKAGGLLLEQERIPHDYCLEQLEIAVR